MNIMQKLKEYFTKPTLKHFHINIVDHCNLNCKYCDHFAPLAKERYVDINKLKQDLEKLSKFINIKAIALMGGEPLLHPNLPQIVEMMRSVLPKTDLTIYTNGLLLPKQKDEFWIACKKNKISIAISRFPIKLDLKEIFIQSKKHKVNIFFYGGTLKNPKKMYKMSIDIEGKQNANETSQNCWQNKGICGCYEDGKLFQCATAGHIHIFSKYFNLELKVSDEDYLDIYKIKSSKEIIEFTKKETPFCKHCNLNDAKTNLEFEISQRDIKEWT